ncbi:MAG: SAP domain-containing protein [Dehalococcoidales bacterium]|nr:SAP domain-containing protein [Dehalococcoidales bacterium]
MPKTAEEPRPDKFRIIPHYSPVTGILTSFTVEDPKGVPVTRWREYATEINKRYPAVPVKELEEAKVQYLEYRAVFTLGRASFTLEQLKGKPAVSELSTTQRLARYGVSEEDYEKVIETDKKFTMNDLRQMCRDLGLATGGDKKKLISRLMEAESGKQS